MSLTVGYLTRHYQGRSGGRDPALLDIAQDHALIALHAEGLFDLGLTLKGGTAMRKFRAGNDGRFSTDLDFACDDSDLPGMVIEALSASTVGDFNFVVTPENETKATLHVQHPTLGTVTIPAKLDFSIRPSWLPTNRLALVHLPIHDVYEAEVPPTPTACVEEAIAEKLARFRRVGLARDLYDLSWYSRTVFDEALVRRVWILKSYFDVVTDGLGTRPIDPDDVLKLREPNTFESKRIGLPTTPVDIPGWLRTVQSRFAFLASVSSEERIWLDANGRDEWSAKQAVASLSEMTPHP